MPKKQPLPLFRYRNKKYRKKLSLWQREKEKKQALKYSHFIIAGAVMFLLSIVVWHAFSFVNFTVGFLKSNHQQGVIHSGRSNIVVDYGKLAIVSVDSTNKTVTVVRFLPDLYVSLPESVGEYRLSKVFDVGEINQKGTGGQLLTKAVEQTFSVPVDGYIKFHKDYTLPTSDLTQLKQRASSMAFLWQFFLTRNFSSTIVTDLSSRDMIAFWWQIRHITSSKIHDVAAFDPKLYNQKALADGSQVLGVSDVLIDNVISENFKDPDVIRQNARVKIVNASGIVGAGTRLAKLIMTIGGNVIRIETADQLVDQSKIVTKDKGASEALVKRLSVVHNFAIIASPVLQDDISDLTVIIGTDY